MNKKNDNKLQPLPYDELPNGWILSTLGDISTKPQYGWTTKANHESGNVKLLRTTDITSGQINWATVPYCSKEPDDLDKYLLEVGDIVISRAGSVGVSYLITDTENAVFASYLIRFRPTAPVDKKYTYYFLKSPDYWKAIGKSTLGIAIPNVNATKLAKVKIPIAPEDEQKRIVEEIEKQFSRLDEAVANLKRIKANLKRYKASVLKAAVEGRLTEEWRKANPDVEPADKLLERILIERHRKWEASELDRMKAKGKVPRDDKWKDKYKEPSQGDISKLIELPNEWLWVSSDQLFWFVTSGSRGWAKYYSDSGAVFLRIGNLNHDSVSFDLKKIKFVKPPKGAEGTRTKVKENDILVSITADVGMIGIVPKGFGEAYINQHISLARPVNSINSLYLAWYLTSRLGQNQFGALQRGATKAGLGLDDIRSVNIPMPPFEEQEEIISKIEKRLSVIDEIDIEVEKNLKRSKYLRQSILKKAFSGKLVPQDPNDEPVSILMEKIKQELVKNGTSKMKVKKRRTKKRGRKLKSSKIKRKLLDVLSEHPDGIRPELLLAEANYSTDEIDGFYAQLGKISSQIYQTKPKGKQALKWPFEAEVTVRLRSK